MTREIILTIFFLILSSLSAQNISQMEVLGNGKYLSNEIITNNKVDANGERCAGLIIISDLSGLSFDSNNGVVDVDSRSGKYFLFLQQNESVVEVYSQEHAMLKVILSDYGINLKSGEVWQITLTGDKKSDLLPVNIIPNVEGAQINIDGEPSGTGSVHQLTPGKHTISISKSGHKTVTKEIEVSETSTLFNYNLSKVQIVGVTIKSNPIGAKIYLNNAEKGETNDQFFEYPGSYQLKLIKSGYLNVEKNINIAETGLNEFN